jgi:hypothetical protein
MFVHQCLGTVKGVGHMLGVVASHQKEKAQEQQYGGYFIHLFVLL